MHYAANTQIFIYIPRILPVTLVGLIIERKTKPRRSCSGEVFKINLLKSDPNLEKIQLRASALHVSGFPVGTSQSNGQTSVSACGL